MGKIPPQAKRVFEGIVFDVYQWEQVLLDGKTTTTFEMLKRADSVATIAVQDGKILVIEDEQPTRPSVLGFPAGRRDPGETALEAAKRELLEETGYRAESWDHYITFEPSHKIDWQLPFFIAKDLHKVQEADPGPGEHITVSWVTFDEFLDIIKDPRFIETHFAYHLLCLSTDELEAFRQRLFGTGLR